MSDSSEAHNAHAELVSEIVAAYVANNHVARSEMPALIRSVHAVFSALNAPCKAEEHVEPPKPAVPVRRSITDEYIISLEDGRKLKSMKRYLAGLGTTPAQHREKWGLPSDYPMVAPAYAAQRSALAKSFGLGRQARGEAEE